MDENVFINITDAVEKDNMVWFFSEEYNGLYSTNIDTKETTFCGMVPWEDKDERLLFETIELIGDQLFLIPSSAKNIAIYNIVTKEFNKLEIDYDKLGNNAARSRNTLFMATCIYKNYLYVFGAIAEVILCIDIETRKINYINDWIEKIEPYIFDRDDAIFRKQTVLFNDKIYIPFCNANALLILDCLTMKTGVQIFGTEAWGYSGIAFDGKNFWLSPRKENGVLLSWEPQTDNREIISLENSSGNNSFVGLLCKNSKVYLFPSKTRNAVWHNLKEIEVMNGNYSFVKEQGECILYYERKSNLLTKYNQINNRKIEIDISVPYETTNLRDKMNNGEAVELRGFSVKQMIGMLENDIITRNKEEERIGYQIYDNILETNK